MATTTSYQNMLNEVIKSPNESRSRKFLKLVKAGMTEAEANNILDQVALFENADAPAEDPFLDTSKAQKKPAAVKSPSMAPKTPKGGSTNRLKKPLKL